MKYIIRILLFVVIGFVSFGYYHKNSGNPEGDKWVGVGILIMALVLMPLFIYHRYNGKDLSKYKFKLNDQEEKNKEKQ
jgi:hypothetical protein